jgi:hypothetical protein
VIQLHKRSMLIKIVVAVELLSWKDISDDGI